jgi:hypothetical protein
MKINYENGLWCAIGIVLLMGVCQCEWICVMSLYASYLI